MQPCAGEVNLAYWHFNLFTRARNVVAYYGRCDWSSIRAMSPEALSEYDSRDFSKQTVHPLCYAPYANLYFDQTGRVRVCSHNSIHVLGNAQRDSIDEMFCEISS
jgi:hypothetical protein